MESEHLKEPLYADESYQSESENIFLDSENAPTYFSFLPSTWVQRFVFTSTTSKSRSRVLDRSGRFFQSRGHWQITNTGDVNRIVPPRVRRFRDDWFHSLAYTPTHQLFAFLFLWYTLTIAFWAAIYYLVSRIGSDSSSHSQTNTQPDGSSYCGMDIANWMEALYFSLSTMSGIGYGVSDYYFGDCILPFVLVLAQILNGIAFDAVAIGLLFQRMSRGQKRGRTIIFSHHAVIQRVKGQYYFMFRVGELRSRHIVDARVRVYCIRHERFPSHSTIGMEDSSQSSIDSYHFLTRHVPLLCDESSLLMSLPHVHVHVMDWKSPLMPPSPVWYDEYGNEHKTFHSNRGSDMGLGSMDTYTKERQNIMDFLQDREAEIVVLLEGTDEVSGTAVQARHSYRWDDVKFDCTFNNCVFSIGDDHGRMNDTTRVNGPNKMKSKMSRGEGEIESSYSRLGSGYSAKCMIDFRKFHCVIAAPIDGHYCPFIPTWIYDTQHEKLI